MPRDSTLNDDGGKGSPIAATQHNHDNQHNVHFSGSINTKAPDVVTDVPHNNNNNDGNDTLRQRTHSVHSVRSVVSRKSIGRGGGETKVRESFAAALWNPMKDMDKNAFNRKRLLQLFAGVLIGTCGGIHFAFGVISNKLKGSYHLSQADMTTISTVGTILGSFTFPAGILYDYAGPQYVLAASTVLYVSGFSMFALIFSDSIPANVYTVAVANGLTYLGYGVTDSGSVMTNLFNFPINRGEVVIIQKTFFGLGSTFITLCFDGFFGRSQNFTGYNIFLGIFTLISGVFGTLVTRLPPYKRTIRELNRIKKLEDPRMKELERRHEERAFEMYHNPRLVDRRRLNAGVTCLFVTLIFFSSFSIVKTYVNIDPTITIILTILACLCILSFGIMVLPWNLPKFFDYDFLPDLRPPEELVDDPKDEDEDKKPTSSGGQLKKQHSDDDDDEVEDTARLIAANDNNKSSQHPISGHDGDVDEVYGSDYDAHHQNGDGNPSACAGRASAFLPNRASVAGNSAPIALPQAIAPSVVPSVTSTFLQSLCGPLLWCCFVAAFSMNGASALLSSNLSQMITSANDGVYDTKINSLSVALQGIGSAVGRVMVGFLQTYMQRRNALMREEQLKWELLAGAGYNAENNTRVEESLATIRTDSSIRDNKGMVVGVSSPPSSITAINGLGKMPDMTPIYHRYTSTVLFLWPSAPAVLAMCILALCWFPVSTYPVINFVFGIGSGAMLSFNSLSARELFSVDTAKHYNFIAASGIVASLLLNRTMFGTWYDAEAKIHPAADGVSCKGYSCFTKSLYVVAGICVLSTISACFIVVRWWKIRQTY